MQLAFFSACKATRCAKRTTTDARPPMRPKRATNARKNQMAICGDFASRVSSEPRAAGFRPAS